MNLEITLVEFSKIITHKTFLNEEKEYHCVDTKFLSTGGLVIYTKSKTFVIYQSDIWKFTVESELERDLRLQKMNPKYQHGLLEALASIEYEDGEIPKTNFKFVKRTTPNKVGTANPIVKIPLSDEVKKYLHEKYRLLPTSLLERNWSDEETDVVFRASTREMSILINRNINTINRMKKLLMEKAESGGVIKETAHIITKPLSELQITHFTHKYRTSDGFRTGEWSDEELKLLFRAKPLKIAIILNRSKAMVYAKRKEIMDNLQMQDIMSDEEIFTEEELEKVS